MNYKITEEVQRKEKINNKKERKNEKNPPGKMGWNWYLLVKKL